MIYITFRENNICSFVEHLINGLYCLAFQKNIRLIFVVNQQFDKGDDFLNSPQDDEPNLFESNITPKGKEAFKKFYTSKNGYVAFNSYFFLDLSTVLQPFFSTKITPDILQYIFKNRCVSSVHSKLTLLKEKKSDYARIAVMLNFTCKEARNIFNKPIHTSDIPKTEKKFINIPSPIYPSIRDFLKRQNLSFSLSSICD